MPDPTNDNFWENIAANNSEETTPPEETFAKGNLTGITPANAKTASEPGAYYKGLHDEIKLDLFGDSSNWDKVGFSEQSNIDLAANTFFGSLVNVAGGFVEGVASNDIKGIFDTSLGNTEAKYGNILNEFSKQLRDMSEENFHIFDDGSNSPFSFEYWGKQLQNTGYSAGIITEMFAEQALLAAATRGQGNVATAGSLANRLKKIPGFLSKQSVFGSYQGIKEAYLNGLQTGDEVYKKYKDLGYSDSEAKEKANQASTLGFRMEVLPLMTLNSLQFAALGKYNPFSKGNVNTGYSGALETLSERALGGIKNKGLKKAADYATQAITEGLEEGLQTAIGKEAAYQVELADGLVGSTQIEDRLFGDEMRDSVIGGALGGTMFRFIGNRFNKLTQGTNAQRYGEAHDKYLETVAQRINNDLGDLNKAFETGDQDKIDVIRKRMQRNNVLEALQLDLINQKESAFDSYISTLQETLDKVNGKSEEDIAWLKSQGVEVVDDVQHIQDNYPVYIDDAVNIKEKLIKNLQLQDDYNVALQLTNHEKTIEELNEFQQRSESVLNDFQTNDTQYNKLDADGKKRFDLILEQTALYVAAQSSSITPEQKARLGEINSELDELGSSGKTDSIINTISIEPLLKEKLNILELQEYETKVGKKIQYWKNPENQRKHTVKKAIKRVKQTEATPDQLNEVKEELEQSGKLTPEVEEIVNDKIEQAEVKSPVAQEGEVNTTTPFGDPVLPSEEELNPERSSLGKEVMDILPELEMIELNEGNASMLEDEQLFEPAELNNLTSSLKDKLKRSVGAYYNNLQDSMKNAPSFSDLVRDFIKHNTKESTDRIYNALVEGWKSNDFPAADFDQIYVDIFKNRKDIAFDILGIADQMIGSSKSPLTLKNENENITKETTKEVSPTVELNSDNQPALKDATPFRTSVSTLKAAHLSIPYKREFLEEEGTTTVVDTDVSDELSDSDYIDSNKLLNPDLFSPGTPLKVRIPTNYLEIKVSTWEDSITKGPSMTFAQWMKVNDVKKGSPEWLAKVPMIAYDQDGVGVFFIHDTEWYNPVNVGFKGDPKKQSEIIEQAQLELTNLRSKLKDGGELPITITSKRPGTWKLINKNEDPISLNSTNPETQLALANDQGELILEGREIFETKGKELINKKEFQRGHVYDIRKVGPNQFIAFEVLRDKLSEASIDTVNNLVEAYLYQYDKNNIVGDNSKIKTMRNQVLSLTNLDVFDRADFETLLNLYVPTAKGKFANAQDIADTVNTNSRIKEGTPFMAVQKGALVFGIKGKNISGKNSVLYIHPRKMGDRGGPQQMVSMLTRFKTLVPNVTQHISKVGLSENRKMVTIGKDKTVAPTETYTEFLKNNLKTSVKSFNVGTKEKPVYATIIQPVINFEIAGETVDIKNPTEKQVEEIKTKEDLTNQEIAIKQSTPEKFDEVDPKQTIKDSINTLLELGVPEFDESIQTLRKELGEETLDEPIFISNEDIEKMKQDVTGIPGLSIINDFHVTDYIFNQLSTKIDFKYKTKVDKAETLKEIQNSYFDFIQPKKEKSEQVLSNLQKLATEKSNLAPVVERLKEEIKIFDTIKEAWPAIEKGALTKLYKFTGIKETSDFIEVELDNGEKEKNYSKISLEENGKSTSSYRLKRFFAGIKNIDANGNVKSGFLGVPTYVGFDKVYSTIEQIISSPYEVDSNFDDMIVRLEESVDNYKWLRQVIEQLKVADPQIQNELVYNFTRHTLSMKFVMFSKNRDGNYTLKTYDTNANEITRVIRRQWESNLRQTPLVFAQNGEYKINKERAKFLLAEFNSWKDKINQGDRNSVGTVGVDNATLQSWLADFGINLSTEALNELRVKGMETVTSTGRAKMPFSKMFQQTSNTFGLFGLLADYLNKISIKEDTSLDENPINHPFNNANNVLKTLSRIESKYALYATTNSFRDGDKSIYGFTPTKASSDIVKKLKFNQDFRDQLGNKSFSKSSYLLELLNNDESFQSKFYLDHIGITSLKELGKKAFGDNSITALSASDHELTKLGLFQDIEQGDIDQHLGENKFVKLRMARMFFPTMSDKSQMLNLYTAVMELKNKHFNITEDQVELTDQLKEIAYSQLVKPELQRITNFVSTIKKTNIKGYDIAAQMFLMVPELNNMVDDVTGKRVLSLLINDPVKYNMQWFEENVKTKAKKVITNLINYEVNNKIEEWKASGFVKEGQNGTQSIEFLDSKYFDNNRLKGSTVVKIKIAANDFVINSLMTNANVHMLIAGDVAMYSQDKIKDYFQNGKPYLPKKGFEGQSVYSIISKDVISRNLGKRLALLLAPGNKLANSKGDKYEQIFLDDFVDITSNVKTLVELFYGKEEGAKAAKFINKYNASTNLKTRKQMRWTLSSNYPELADYFEIETTDAQEYTTLSEHINVLWRQGRLASEVFHEIQNKINNSEDLTFEELKIVLQPIKPVYTGFKNEERFDAMRMMYIKSSSFPLIPQVTRGTELDNLRNLLEKREATTGKSVRASYQSANKVGAVTNPITVFNPDGTFNNKLTDQDIAHSALVLDRDNFRIQQDVPFKSAKVAQDKVSLGTQTLKLLFGDGMLDVNDFTYDGETITGKELKSKFDQNYDDYVKLKRDILYKQLGIDKTGQPENVVQTMNKLQDLLKREAIDRGYPKQDIEALKLVPKLDKEGKVVDVQFSIPLWLSPNSNRYESLLNAIVTNRLVKIKLPGNAYVVGSEAGFKMKEDLDGVNRSKIIFTSKWEGSLQAAKIKEGKLQKAQVLVPSKFRDNEGNLINLLSDKYTYRDESGVLRLKEDMIDPELLGLTSFRIPTSAHVSMSQIEIVGILPTEVGDLMIVPKNFSKQKGLDYDVDKETTYQLHTYMDQEGKIKVLNEEVRQQLLKEADPDTKVYADSSPESKLMRGIFGEDPDFNINELEPGEKLDKINDKLQEKLYENELVKTHAAVLSNVNPVVQKKINKTLSIDFAKSQATLIDSKIEGEADNTFFSLLSDSYQKDRMELGASGKLGIGVYSNYVVFHSMVQQAAKPIQLKGRDEKGKIVPVQFQIGSQVSNGTLGNQNSLASGKLKRSISEIFAERQNTATDNEKEQIMGRVNVNEITINVDSLLSALGFDKDTLSDGSGREVSVPYLVLSQPIIREYVAAMRKTQSNTQEYDSAAKEKVIAALKEKYTAEVEYNAASVPQMFTGQTLYNNLTAPNNMIQTEILNLFLELDDYAKNLSLLQSRLNINRSGLGKSFFDTIEKYYGVQNIVTDYKQIENASELIGDFIAKNEDVTPRVEKNLIAQGYIDFGEYYIKPNNAVSSMLITSVSTGYNLWKDFFPFNDANVKIVMKEILDEISDENTSATKVIEMQQNIFKEMKKYFVSSDKLEVFSGDPQQERARLFIDNDTNTSLASYMRDLVFDPEGKYDLLRNNKLLSRFQYDINTNGLPSLIKFDNTKGENFDEDYLYLSLIELIEADSKLPNFNGKEYTTRTLAQDLIAYNYLEGGIQEAIQFSKYIPVSYLNTINFGIMTREWNEKYRPGIFKSILGRNGVTSSEVSRFTKQYIQNNPQRLRKIDPDTQISDAVYLGSSKDLSGLMEFGIKAKELDDVESAHHGGAKFLAIYNPSIKKGLKKFQVYERSGNKFKRVSTLGVFGMSEYAIKSDDIRSNVNDYYRPSVPVKKVTVQKESAIDPFDLSSSSTKEIFDSLADYNYVEFPHLKPLVKALLPYIPSNLKIEVADLLNKNGDRVARGRYNSGTNTITIDTYYKSIATQEDLAKTIVHELIHDLTSTHISKFVDNDGNYKMENPPKEIVDLVLLFNETVRKLGPEIEAYKDKRRKQLAGETTEGTTERERTVAYAGTNIKEFVTLVMTEPNFQKEMMDTMYRQSDKSLFEKFSDIVHTILGKILGQDFDPASITAQGIQTTLQIVSEQSKLSDVPTLLEQQRTEDAMTEAMATGFGDAIIPDDSELNLDEPSEKSIFVIPFKCK